MEEKSEDQLTKIYPNGLTGKEIIYRITEVYHAGYDLNNSNFDIYDQLLACEAVAEAEEEEKRKINFSYHLRDETMEDTNTNAHVNGMVNDSCKRNVNFELTQSKLEIVAKLKVCKAKTPPSKISYLLEELFKEYESKQGHWLYISQHYTPRVINWNLNYMVKCHIEGRKTFLNWAAYFTESIKWRTKRKVL